MGAQLLVDMLGRGRKQVLLGFPLAGDHGVSRPRGAFRQPFQARGGGVLGVDRPHVEPAIPEDRQRTESGPGRGTGNALQVGNLVVVDDP